MLSTEAFRGTATSVTALPFHASPVSVFALRFDLGVTHRDGPLQFGQLPAKRVGKALSGEDRGFPRTGEELHWACNPTIMVRSQSMG
ncbi:MULTISPECIES: hypothetical protein [Bradyrhizobium]|uniref:hypothetical protein n=1 Tax=Bradyrhizobium TaxID=374 RepID=UPI0010299E7F|nr:MULTISPECIES: hypothetical protein [Bradyrhizobium]